MLSPLFGKMSQDYGTDLFDADGVHRRAVLTVRSLSTAWSSLGRRTTIHPWN